MNRGLTRLLLQGNSVSDAFFLPLPLGEGWGEGLRTNPLSI